MSRAGLRKLRSAVFSRRVLLRSESGKYTAQPATIFIEDGKISDVVRQETVADGTDHDDVDFQDFGDALITPAFINAHTHTPMNALRGVGKASALKGNVVEDLFFKIERLFEPGDIRAFTRMGAYENLLAGVGTVWEHYYGGVELAEGLRDVGINAVVAPTLQDLNGPGVPILEEEWVNTIKILDDEFAASGIVPCLGPHATDTVSEDLWQRVLALAEEHSLPIHFHNAQSCEEYQRSFDRHNCSPVERLQQIGVLDSTSNIVLVHNLFVNDHDLSLLSEASAKNNNISMVFCPFAQMQFDFPAHVASWVDAGIPFLLGTDAAASNDAMCLQSELKSLSNLFSHRTTFSPEHERFRRSGLPQDAIEVQNVRKLDFEHYADARGYSATLDTVLERPGKLHPSLQCGSISPGYQANLVAWDPEHPNLWPFTDAAQSLVLCNATPAINNVMIQGSWKHPDGHDAAPGEFHQAIRASAEYTDAKSEATDRLQKLLERLS